MYGYYWRPLYLPQTLPAAGCPEGSIPYIVQPGDTFYSIAQKVTTTVDALIDANPGVNPYRLVAGQEICVPIPRPHFR